MTLELRVAAPGDIDAAVAHLREVRLERHAGRIHIVCDRAPISDVIVALARAGVDATPVVPSAAPALRPAVVDHLDPISFAETRDVVSVRCAPLGEAIDLVRAATRDLFGRRAPERRERLASLLQERDRLLLWRRVLYAPSGLLRTSRIPGVRPLVFDPDGAARAPEHPSFASAGRLSAWIGT